MKTITQLMQLSKQQRQAHIDLTSPCIPARSLDNARYLKQATAMSYAKNELLDTYNIAMFNKRTIHTCHLCKNNSQAHNGFICINPKHLYFGTVSENQLDKPESIRKEAASKGGKAGGRKGLDKVIEKYGKEHFQKIANNSTKKALKSGNYMNQQKRTCIHCGAEGNPGNIGRYHNNNCKHKV